MTIKSYTINMLIFEVGSGGLCLCQLVCVVIGLN